MPATVSDVWRGFVGRILTLGGTWWEAPVPFDLFGVSQVPDAVPATKAHLAFVVGVPSTPSFEERQVPRDGALASTEVGVRFLARHKPGPEVSQGSAMVALTAEQDLVKRLMDFDTTWPVTFNLRLQSVARSCPAPGNWFLHDVRFTAFHRFALR